MSRPKLHECSFTFVDSDPSQDITISVEDCGGGPYFVVKTDRWSVDDIDEFVNLFADVAMFAKDNMG